MSPEKIQQELDRITLEHAIAHPYVEPEFRMEDIPIGVDKEYILSLKELGAEVPGYKVDDACSVLFYEIAARASREHRSLTKSRSVVSGRMAWINEPPTKWEEKTIDPVDVPKIRTRFLSHCVGRMLRREEIEDHLERWDKGYFDCVTKEYLVMGMVWVSWNPKILLKHGLPGSFGTVPCLFDEPDYQTLHSNEGRVTLSCHHLKEMHWGPDKGNFLAVRSKIAGSRFVLGAWNGGRALLGFRNIQVHSHCPVNVAEYWAGNFYIVHPHALPSFTDPVSQIHFLAHPFYHPYDFVPHPAHEGVMVLTHNGELRCKEFPTVEWKDPPGKKGIWEVCYARLGQKTSLYALRPRPGKIPSFSEMAIRSQICAVDFLSGVPPDLNYMVKEVFSGSSGGQIVTQFKDVARVIIDSTCRLCLDHKFPVSLQHLVTPWIILSDEEPQTPLRSVPGFSSYMLDGKQRSFSHYVTSKRDKKAETTYKVGAKVFTFLHKNLVMFKDADTGHSVKKPWDHLGGAIATNVVEIPVETAIRELKEEAGLVRDATKLHFIGITDESDDHGRSIWRSFVYMTMITDAEFAQMQQFVVKEAKVKGSEFRLVDNLQVMEGSQPWVERHNCLFVQKCGYIADAWRAMIAHDGVFIRVPFFPEDTPLIRTTIMASYANCNMDPMVSVALIVGSRRLDIFMLKQALAYFGHDIPASPNSYFYVSRGAVVLTEKATKLVKNVAARERAFHDYVGERVSSEEV